jgi:hypothetical protein
VGLVGSKADVPQERVNGCIPHARCTTWISLVSSRTQASVLTQEVLSARLEPCHPWRCRIYRADDVRRPFLGWPDIEENHLRGKSVAGHGGGSEQCRVLRVVGKQVQSCVSRNPCGADRRFSSMTTGLLTERATYRYDSTHTYAVKRTTAQPGSYEEILRQDSHLLPGGAHPMHRKSTSKVFPHPDSPQAPVSAKYGMCSKYTQHITSIRGMFMFMGQAAP